MRQNRFKSWALWLGIAALVGFCLKTFFKIDCGEALNSFMDALLPILVAFGVVNNPTNKTGY